RLTEGGVMNPLTDLGAVGIGRASESDSGLKSALQVVIADVAEEHGAGGGEQLHGAVDEVGQIPRVGEVLDDRVHDDGVEVAAPQSVGDVCGLSEQFDPITPR